MVNAPMDFRAVSLAVALQVAFERQTFETGFFT
jgi:hypothetical protein